MRYTQTVFVLQPFSETATDILSALLADIGFESFVVTENSLEAYIPTALFSEKNIDEIIVHFPLDEKISYSFTEIEEKNWNEEWEKHYFQPIVIADKCIIQSSFHHQEGEYQYRIFIDPKMAFGTGHHQTTGLILRDILDMDLNNKSVLDMGTGTAVLAILASMRGANPVLAVDIDEWAYNNARENIERNNISNIRTVLGGAEALGGESFDVIFANINRNILLQDIPVYEKALNTGGTLIVSGFYKRDIPAVREKCESCGLVYTGFREQDDWVSVTCKK
ncbi:MAG: 50S ribosomal protein L11 methyltransferase [Dysgonamonadaceae bacterium]|jgi:ribosomal protein L11 methyltransferase|nr:50S ribosomal protein L11 methyltransferase [Dysgonamonadaceae bacterium]